MTVVVLALVALVMFTIIVAAELARGRFDDFVDPYVSTHWSCPADNVNGRKRDLSWRPSALGGYEAP